MINRTINKLLPLYYKNINNLIIINLIKSQLISNNNLFIISPIL